MKTLDIRRDLQSPPRCAATGKLRHANRRKAKRLAKFVRSNRDKKVWVYRCEWCAGFHLTRMDREVYRMLQDRYKDVPTSVAQ